MLVTSVEQQKKNKHIYNIFVDNQFAFSLIIEDIYFFGIKEGNEISEEKYEYIKNTVVYIKAQNESLKYIGYKMRTEKEVEKRLNSSGYDLAIINRVIEFLKKYNYVNDFEYACAYIRQCSKLNPKGSYVIRCKLREFGVGEDVINEALNAENPDEVQQAEMLLEKKLKGRKEISFKEKRKLQEFLLRKGYCYDIIKEVFSKMDIKVEDIDMC